MKCYINFHKQFSQETGYVQYTDIFCNIGMKFGLLNTHVREKWDVKLLPLLSIICWLLFKYAYQYKVLLTKYADSVANSCNWVIQSHQGHIFVFP